MKRLVALILCLATIAVLFSGCLFSRCVSCGNSGTRNYYNSALDKYQPYCKSCSRYCAQCGAYAKKHYTGSMGNIVFVCYNCYTSTPNQ